MKEVKPTSWFDTKKRKEVYGFKVKFEDRWLNAADDDGALFYDTEEDRDSAVNDYKNAH